MAKRITFFATLADLTPVLEAVEAKRPLKYTLMGLLELPALQSWDSGLKIPQLGTALAGQQPQERYFLVTAPDIEVQIEPVPQRRGGVRYDVAQDENPQSVVVQPGGMFRDQGLIVGEILTASSHPVSTEFFKLFSQEIKKRFVRIKSDYVGPEAERLLDNGGRLTANVRAPPLYDLSRT
jgi:hypothetical protein